MEERRFQGEIKRASKFPCLITFIALTVIFLTTTIIFIVLFAKLKNENDSKKDNSVIIEYPSPERFIKVLTKVSENNGSFVK
jgi:hypothetical protein